MKVTETTARKIVIADIELDPVTLYLEDLGEARGKATITCCDDSWSYYWNAMGKRSIAEFLLQADNDYLARKFSRGISSRIADMDALAKEAQKEVLAQRRRRACDAFEARELFDACPGIAGCDRIDQCDTDLMQQIFGDEWWQGTGTATKPNPKYKYICRILDAVKAALKELVGARKSGTEEGEIIGLRLYALHLEGEVRAHKDSMKTVLELVHPCDDPKHTHPICQAIQTFRQLATSPLTKPKTVWLVEEPGTVDGSLAALKTILDHAPEKP